MLGLLLVVVMEREHQWVLTDSQVLPTLSLSLDERTLVKLLENFESE